MSLSFILWLFWFYLVERWDFCLTLKPKYSYYYLINSCCITHAISSNVFLVETGLYITNKIGFYLKCWFILSYTVRIIYLRFQQYYIKYLCNIEFRFKIEISCTYIVRSRTTFLTKSLFQDRSDFSKRFEVSISLFHFYLFSLSYLKHISSIGIQWIESRVFGFYILLLFILAIEQHCKPNNITTKTHLRG